jgi:hypothetical protein
MLGGGRALLSPIDITPQRIRRRSTGDAVVLLCGRTDMGASVCVRAEGLEQVLCMQLRNTSFEFVKYVDLFGCQRAIKDGDVIE